METKTLNEIMQFTLGKNSTRIKENKAELYNADDFEKDLHSINASNESSVCIINLTKSKASPLSNQTYGKCITSNFIKCKFDINILDPWYFCYQFNEGRNFEQQIGMYNQGSTSSVKKLNVKIIGELKISLPDIKKQRIIGAIYKQSIIQNDLMLKRAEDLRELTMALIRRIEED